MKKLKAPLSFQGGKQRVADRLVEVIKGDVESTQYVDLCCGSGAVSVELINQGVHPENITMVDASDWGSFWRQVSEGTFDMCWFEDIINDVPADKDLIKPHLEKIAKEGYDPHDHIDTTPYWLLLQAGSFGGKHIWTKEGKFQNASFRSYWKPTPTSSRRSPVNPMMPMPYTLLKQVRTAVESMASVKAVHGNVEDFNWDYYEKIRQKDNIVVFIDPPYDGTTGYGVELNYQDYLANVLQALPDNYSVYITDYQQHSSKFWVLSNTKKGGISGGSKSRIEILSQVK